jgi:hypothetical protein
LTDLVRLGGKIAHPEWMGGWERNVRRPGRSIDRRAQGIGEKHSFRCGVAGRDLVTRNDGEFAGRNGGQVLREAIQ